MSEYIQNGVEALMVLIVSAIIICLVYVIFKLVVSSVSVLSRFISLSTNDRDDKDVLLIEYKIESQSGTKDDLAIRHALEDRMQKTLSVHGLGFCDGGGIGGGIMEVCCIVTDFEAAKKIIEQDLQGTGFANYYRIYNL